MAQPTLMLDWIDRVRDQVLAERRRAARSAEIAARHDRLAATGRPAMRQFHAEKANANRELETRHLVAASIHASHLARLRASVQAVMLASPLDRAAGGRRVAALGRPGPDRSTARSVLAADLPMAIDTGDIGLEYQPVVSFADGHIVGAEALVRWRHPELGLLLPDQFLDLAEQTGMMPRLGEHVLNQACVDAARWHEAGAGVPYVSVNITPQQVLDSDIVQDVAAALDRTGLPASRLVLEITEGSIVQPDRRSVEALDRVVGLGVSIAIDDFGTGYSNLSYLRRLPVSIIKIDRTFVADLIPTGERPDDTGEEVLAAIVSLAHALGLDVVAEGVETMSQAEWLQSISADSAQGWYFGRSVGAEQIAAAIAVDT